MQLVVREARPQGPDRRERGRAPATTSVGSSWVWHECGQGRGMRASRKHSGGRYGLIARSSGLLL